MKCQPWARSGRRSLGRDELAGRPVPGMLAESQYDALMRKADPEKLDKVDVKATNPTKSGGNQS